FFLENDHFVPLQVFYHLGLHGRTFYDRGANGDVTSVFQKKDLVKGDFFSFFFLQTVNVHFLVFCNFELLPCHLYNCVHNALIRLKLSRFNQLSGCKYTAKSLIYKRRSSKATLFFGVVDRFIQLHDSKGQDHGGGKAHDCHREEDDTLKVFVVTGPSPGKVLQKGRVDLSGIECKEKGEQNGGDKTAYDPGGKAIAVPKALVLSDSGILDGLMDPQTGDQCIGHAVKYIGVLPKKGQDQKIGHQYGGGHKSETDGKGHFFHGLFFLRVI